MPQSPEEKMDYSMMLEELADQYPELKKKAMELKDDVMELMPEMDMEEEMQAPIEVPELDLEDEEEDEIELEL